MMIRKSKLFGLSCCAWGLILVLRISADSFTFSSDRMSTVLTKGKEHTILSGNAHIISDKTNIYANEIELYGEDYRYALCRGDVTVVDEEKGIFLKCDELYFDRKKDISRIEGYAEMEDYKNELVVKAGFLENFGKDDITVVQIGVRILKEDMACRSEFARYKRKEKILELSGMPLVYWKGDEYKASRIIINLDTDEIKLAGEVSGTVVSKSEESKEKKTTTEDSATGGNESAAVDGVREQAVEEKKPEKPAGGKSSQRYDEAAE
ncbi:MAG: LptA/OstA family protein [Spirochaetota bacterium]